MKYALALITLFCFSCYNVQRDCNAFKTGTFKSEVTIDNTLYTSIFVRTKDLQVETYDGKTDSSSIRWINDCEMIFRTINPKNRAERKDIHLKMLITTDSSYTFEYSYVGDTKKQKGIAYRLE